MQRPEINGCFLISSNVINDGEFLHPFKFKTAVMLLDKRENSDLQSYTTFIKLDAEQRGENSSSSFYMFFCKYTLIVTWEEARCLNFLGESGLYDVLEIKKKREISSDVKKPQLPCWMMLKQCNTSSSFLPGAQREEASAGPQSHWNDRGAGEEVSGSGCLGVCTDRKRWTKTVCLRAKTKNVITNLRCVLRIMRCVTGTSSMHV